MIAARYDFAAVNVPDNTTLPSSRVIVAGGYASANTLVPANTASESLSMGGTPPFQWSTISGFAPRAQLQMVLLNVLTIPQTLATGGLDGAGTALNTAQIYSYQTYPSWTATVRNMTTARSQHQMVALQDGRALVAGVPSFPQPPA